VEVDVVRTHIIFSPPLPIYQVMIYVPRLVKYSQVAKGNIVLHIVMGGVGVKHSSEGKMDFRGVGEKSCQPRKSSNLHMHKQYTDS